MAIMSFPWSAAAQKVEDCMMCHEDKTLTTKREGRTVSLFVDAGKFASSIHGSLTCVDCHTDLQNKEFPHEAKLAKVACGTCHTEEEQQHAGSLHGKAVARGDVLAPRCKDCHGNHDILPVKNPLSAVAPGRIPYVCGKCHSEGTPVQRQREIHESNIIENYSESMHGEALLKKGLVVAATCVSCHTAHQILPHTDPRSSIARRNIAATCTKCHAQIEYVHRKVIKGELWEKELHVLPACVDCHQPHKVRKVFYDQGMADADCLRCHDRIDIKSSKDGRSLRVDASEFEPFDACEAVVQPVSCRRQHLEPAALRDDHPEGGLRFLPRRGGSTVPAEHSRAAFCEERSQRAHLSGVSRHPRCPWEKGSGLRRPFRRMFRSCAPNVIGSARRRRSAIPGPEKEIVERYTESIHGKGLLKSGLVVTAMCTSCHTAHRELPHDNPQSSVNVNNVPATCGNCHNGIEEQFEHSVHSGTVSKSDKPLPVCNDCHSAHTIRRTDERGVQAHDHDPVRPVSRGRLPRPISTPITARYRSSGTPRRRNVMTVTGRMTFCRSRIRARI